jgi:hypothetical protein
VIRPGRARVPGAGGRGAIGETTGGALAGAEDSVGGHLLTIRSASARDLVPASKGLRSVGTNQATLEEPGAGYLAPLPGVPGSWPSAPPGRPRLARHHRRRPWACIGKYLHADHKHDRRGHRGMPCRPRHGAQSGA